MTYSEKLKDPRWQKKRLEILQAADFACEDCTNKEKELQVHHCIYVKGRNPWEYNGNSLICLCVDCHLRRGEIEEHIKRSVASILRFSSVPILENVAQFAYGLLLSNPKWIPGDENTSETET